MTSFWSCHWSQPFVIRFYRKVAFIRFYGVKVQTWADGKEDAEFVGVGTRFGTAIVSKEKNANQIHLTLSNPRDCCSAPKHKLDRDVIMVHRSHCKFTTKAINAEAAGASAMLIINSQ